VFDKILNKVCFIDDAFTVEPQYPLPQAVGVPSVGFVITYVVEVNDLPIFFLEIKPPLHLDYISSRIDSDAQMRARFRALYDVAPTPSFMRSVSWDRGLPFIAWTKPRAM
jgi:hypothetical protein